MAVGDVNGDGYPDLVVSNPSDLVVLLGNGDGTFGPPSLIATLGSAGLVKLGDFNGDGRLDILVLDSGDGGFWILLNNGAGSFSTPVVYSGIVSLPSDVAIADINGDGILDVMISDASRFTSQIGLALGRSDGSFAPIAPVDLTSLLDGVNEIAVVDFNGDGQRDIAGTLSGASGTAQNIVLLYGKGDGEFEPPKTLGPVGAPHGFAAADLNGDGVPDLSVVFSNRILTFLMRRNGTFGLFAYPGPELSATVTIADVNGDGLPDMIAAGVETGEIWLYVGTSCGTFQTPILFPSGAQLPFKITVADVNGDGAPD